MPSSPLYVFECPTFVGCDNALAILCYGVQKATAFMKPYRSGDVRFYDLDLEWSSKQVGLWQNSAQSQLNELDKIYWVLTFYAMV